MRELLERLAPLAHTDPSSASFELFSRPEFIRDRAARIGVVRHKGASYPLVWTVEKKRLYSIATNGAYRTYIHIDIGGGEIVGPKECVRVDGRWGAEKDVYDRSRTRVLPPRREDLERAFMHQRYDYTNGVYPLLDALERRMQ